MIFDKRVSKVIPKNSSDDFVLNKKFVGHKEKVRDLIYSSSDCYSESDSLCIDLAMKHYSQNSSGRKDDDVVVLVHPFYPSFAHYDRIIEDPLKNQEYEKYMFNLNKFLKENKRDLVLFETVQHYLAFTSRLVEEGLVSEVIFTEKDYGYPYSKDEFNKIDFERASVGGVYGGHCLDSALNRLEFKDVDIFGIKDLSLKELSYNNISNGVGCYVEKNKRISLDDVL